MDDLEKILDAGVEKVEKSPVQLEFEDAIEKAKVFHPVTKLYVDGYTGEVNRYKTPDNYVPDEGVKNTKPDLCHTEDHISIAQIYARLKNMHALSISAGEYEFDEQDIDGESLEQDTLADFADIQEDAFDSSEIESALVDKYAAESASKGVERDKADLSTEPSDAEEGAPESA